MQIICFLINILHKFEHNQSYSTSRIYYYYNTILISATKNLKDPPKFSSNPQKKMWDPQFDAATKTSKFNSLKKPPS